MFVDCWYGPFCPCLLIVVGSMVVPSTRLLIRAPKAPYTLPALFFTMLQLLLMFLPQLLLRR